jgi:hypothetical protein
MTPEQENKELIKKLQSAKNVLYQTWKTLTIKSQESTTDQESYILIKNVVSTLMEMLDTALTLLMILDAEQSKQIILTDLLRKIDELKATINPDPEP